MGPMASLLGSFFVVPAQAVGQAVGRNPLTILVPCHRVMGKDGQLTGYASGLDQTLALTAWKELSGRRNKTDVYLY